MNPMFARPEGVIPLSDQSAFIALLEKFNVPFRTWNDSEAKLAKLWDEVKNNDTVYTTTHSLFGSHRVNMPVRFLITVAAWVAIRFPDNETRILIEYKLNEKTGHYERRKHEGSASEKVKLDADGRPAEGLLATLLRCLAEEAGITIEEREMSGQFHFNPHQSDHPLIGTAWGVEQDSREKKKEMPGLWHFNQVAHYYAYLPERAHFLAWRREAATKYLSRWGSAQDSVVALDPIPANFVDLSI